MSKKTESSPSSLLKPGTDVSVVVSIDHIREAVDVRRSIIHDVTGRAVIMAQTDPPISRLRTGKDLYVTFVDRLSSRGVRYGFTAVVEEFLSDYLLSSGKKARAIRMRRVSGLEEYNVRMFYRLEPPGDCGLEMFLNGLRVNILDISLGGAKISHNSSIRLPIGIQTTAEIDIDGKQHRVDAIVLRAWEPEDARLRGSISYAAIHFPGIDARFRTVLARKIADVERSVHNAGQGAVCHPILLTE